MVTVPTRMLVVLRPQLPEIKEAGRQIALDLHNFRVDAVQSSGI